MFGIMHNFETYVTSNAEEEEEETYVKLKILDIYVGIKNSE